MQFLSVTKANPCPICGKPDWCALSEDGAFRLCRRVGSNGRRKTDSAGSDYWVYSTDDSIDIANVVLPQIPDADEEIPRASAADLDRVYRALLKGLSLSDEHTAQLKARGLSAAAIKRRGYRTLAKDQRARLAKALETEFGQDLAATVPGLSVWRDQVGDHVTVGGDAGLLLPVIDVNGQIVALKARRDDPPDGIRYRYLSSKRHGGPGPGAPPHVPHPHKDPTERVRLTEGELKADVATELSGMLTISVAGVSAWRSAIPVMKALKTRSVVLAYDADAQANLHVAMAIHGAVGGLRTAGFTVEMETWPLDVAKGIDDLLAAGHQPDLVTGEDVDTLIGLIVQAATEANPSPAEHQLREKLSHAWVICELAKDDAGAPFEAPSLATFAFVREASAADWQRIRTALKDCGVAMRDLERASTPLAPPNGAVQAEDGPDNGSSRADRPDGLPEVRVDDRYMHEISDDALAHLMAASTADPRIFNKGGALVTITDNRHGISSRAISGPGMKGILDRTARFVRMEKTGLVPARPPDDVVSDILSLEDMPFAPLTAISQAPLVLPDGQMVHTSGYDQGSGYLVRLNGLSAVRADMPIADAVNMLLDDVYGDFPFVDDASRAHVVSLILQPFLMALIARPTPMYLIEGPKAGTGKGLVAEVVGIVTHNGAVGTTGEPVEEEEFRKRAFTLLLESHTLIWIDNVSRLKSAALDRMLTSYTHTDRVLGASRLATVTNNATWVATGNNVLLSDEMARRVALIRMDAGMQNPEERKDFRHPNLAEWVAKNRVQIVTACLSIIQAWIDAGMPPGKETIGSFERWAKVMGGVLDVAGVPGFLGNREMVKAASDTESVEWEALCKAWWDQNLYLEVRASDVLDIAKRSELLMDVWAGRQDHKGMQRFGYELKKRRDQVYGVWTIRTADAKSGSGANLYYLDGRRE